MGMSSTFKYVNFLTSKKISFLSVMCNVQKQPPSGVLRKRCSENMKQICRRTPMPKCDFSKVAKQLY